VVAAVVDTKVVVVEHPQQVAAQAEQEQHQHQQQVQQEAQTQAVAVVVLVQAVLHQMQLQAAMVVQVLSFLSIQILAQLHLVLA
jgi:hypothetical protein